MRQAIGHPPQVAFLEADEAFGGRSRLVVAVRSRGCSHARQRKACIYCAGFHDPLCCTSARETVRSFGKAVSSWAGHKVDILSILCPGSFLDEDDVPRPIAEELLHMVKEAMVFETITFEARPEFVRHGSLEWLRTVIGDGQAEIAVGFDTVSDAVRNRLIGKGVSRRQITMAVARAHRWGFRPVPFVVAQPPGIPTKGALREATATVDFLSSIGADMVWLEPIRIVLQSELGRLWERGAYQPPDEAIFEDILAACSARMVTRRGGAIGSPAVVAKGDLCPSRAPDVPRTA